jgi:hypothetical protein
VREKKSEGKRKMREMRRRRKEGEILEQDESES